MGTKIVTDFDASEGDTLEFQGYSVAHDHTDYVDYDGNGTLDSVIYFVSDQGGSGAHDGDDVGRVVVLDTIVDAPINVADSLFFGVLDTWSMDG